MVQGMSTASWRCQGLEGGWALGIEFIVVFCLCLGQDYCIGSTPVLTSVLAAYSVNIGVDPIR